MVYTQNLLRNLKNLRVRSGNKLKVTAQVACYLSDQVFLINQHLPKYTAVILSEREGPPCHPEPELAEGEGSAILS